MGPTIDLTAGGTVWRVRRGPDGPSAEEVALLFGAEGPRLEEWLASGQAHIVKNGPHRTVYRVALASIDVHVKFYRPSGKRALAALAALRNSPARREYVRTLAVAARGAPTLRPLAVGERGPGGRGGSYLITATLPGACPLDGLLEKLPAERDLARQARLRMRLAVALGRLLAGMHEAGVTQWDLHPGNVLVQLGEEPRLALIDLASVRLGGPLSWRASRANLVILNRWFMLRWGRADRLRCWRAYEEARWGARSRDKARPRDLEWRTLVSNLRFWRQADDRCVSVNRYFRQVVGLTATGPVVGHAVADLPDEALAPLLADSDAPFTRGDVKVLKHAPTSSVVELGLPMEGVVRRVIYKRFAVAKWADPFVALLRPTPALRSYVMGHGLRLRGLPTPRPLAVWHRVRHGLRHEGYLITEKVADAQELVAFVSSLSALSSAERRAVLRPLIDQVARLIRTMHARHLSHRDLKASNLLVSSGGWRIAAKGVKEIGAAAESKEGPQVWFIDLVGARRHGKLRRGRRLQNLARLHTSFYQHPDLTRTDKLRFLRVYLGWGLRGRLGWKRWWREVETATRAKVQRNLRTGRPLG
jgi:tRNA A-37 threonylcarbamoyl transferase component Bud32